MAEIKIVEIPNIKYKLNVDYNTFWILMGLPFFKVDSKLVMEETALNGFINQAAKKAGFTMAERDNLLHAIRDEITEHEDMGKCTMNVESGEYILERLNPGWDK
jgi:hypothetical protein